VRKRWVSGASCIRPPLRTCTHIPKEDVGCPWALVTCQGDEVEVIDVWHWRPHSLVPDNEVARDKLLLSWHDLCTFLVVFCLFKGTCTVVGAVSARHCKTRDMTSLIAKGSSKLPIRPWTRIPGPLLRLQHSSGGKRRRKTPSRGSQSPRLSCYNLRSRGSPVPAVPPGSICFHSTKAESSPRHPGFT